MNSSENTSLAKKSISSAKFTIIFRGLAQVMSLLAIVVLVRVLSQHDYGVYSLLYTAMSVIGMLFSFGIANTLQRFIPDYYSRGEFKIANTIQNIAMLIRLVSNISIIFIFFAFWDNIAPLLKIEQFKEYFFLFTIVIILHFQRGILEVCLTSYFLHKYSQGLSCIFILLKGMGYISALVFSWDLWAILIIDLIASIVVFIGLQLAYWNKIPKDKGTIERIGKRDKKRLIRYAFFYNFNDAGVGLLDSSTDNLFLAFYLNPVAVGAYAFCHKFTFMVGRIMPISYLIEVIRPAFFTQTDRQTDEGINRNFQLMLKLIYLFQLPTLIFICVFAEQLIMVVFDGKFIEYSGVLIAVFLFSVINAFQLPVGLVIQLKEKVEIVLYSKIFAVYNIIANIILIPIWGVWGAVFATGTASLFKNLFVWFFVRREATVFGMSKFFIFLSIYWLTSGFLVLLFIQFIESNFVALMLGIVSFIALLFISGNFLFLNKNEQDFLNHLTSSNQKLKKILTLININLENK